MFGGASQWKMICDACAEEHKVKPIGMAPAKSCALCGQVALSRHPVDRIRFSQLERERKAAK